MRREVRMEDISDGKLYRAEDLVRAGCGGCEGCSACCRHMGESVILDPLDIYNLNIGAKVGLGELYFPAIWSCMWWMESSSPP